MTAARIDHAIAWLDDADPRVDLLGGKGASLARLASFGFRIPRGFCLTTDAFRAQRASLLRDRSAQFASAPMETRLAASLEHAVARLVEAAGGEATPARFAVRSSAVAEDGSAASYAGLHETELDVAPGEVAGAIQRCWASLWSAPAVAYRERRGLPDSDAAMAVVVQALVAARASAVAFTRHPVTDRDDQIVVTAVRGLGDAMVAGTVTPDTYVVDRSSRAVVTFDRGDDPNGAALGPTDLRDLVELCLQVEARFGRAVDIEAAMADDGWYLLQARPITTGSPAAAGVAAG